MWQTITQILSDPEQTLKAITALVGVAGLWFGVWQYRAARIWKRQEFTASVSKELSTDPDLSLALLFLDWRERPMRLPERFVVAEKDERTFIHSHQKLAAAFSLNSRVKVKETNNLDFQLEFATQVNFMYVDVVDSLLCYLERVNTFVSLGLLKRKEIDGIVYWAARVCELKVDGIEVFHGYLKHYKYNGVLALGNSMTAVSPPANVANKQGQADAVELPRTFEKEREVDERPVKQRQGQQ